MPSQLGLWVYNFKNRFVGSFYHNTCRVKRIKRFFEKSVFWDRLVYISKSVNIWDELWVLELMVLVKYGGSFELENYRTLLLTPELLHSTSIRDHFLWSFISTAAYVELLCRLGFALTDVSPQIPLWYFILNISTCKISFFCWHQKFIEH